MSKFHVDLCLPPTDAKHLPEAIATAMAPFRVDQPGDWSEDWIWDWWHINSYEDSGDFAVRAEHDGDTRLIWEPTYPNGDLRERAPLRRDGGLRGLLDFEITRSEGVPRARVTWKAQRADFRRLLAEHPPARPLTAFLTQHQADPEAYPRERAAAEHHAQPLVRAPNHRGAWERYPGLGVWVLGPDSDPITAFTRDPEPEIDRTPVNALLSYALLTLDGGSIQRDRLGPFASPQPGEAADALRPGGYGPPGEPRRGQRHRSAALPWLSSASPGGTSSLSKVLPRTSRALSPTSKADEVVLQQLRSFADSSRPR